MKQQIFLLVIITTIAFPALTSPAGIYFIRIDDTGNTLIKKVVKQ